MKIYMLLVGFVIFISGCSPVYVVKNEYIPSNDRVCLKKCQTDRIQCQKECNSDFSRCVAQAKEKAYEMAKKEEKIYNKRFLAYLKDKDRFDFEILEWRDRYDVVYRDWNYFREECKKNPKNSYACERRDDLRAVIKRMLKSKPKSPKMPKKVTFEKIFKDLQSGCERDCGCQELFDSCFVSCGGSIYPHRICVRNCD